MSLKESLKTLFIASIESAKSQLNISFDPPKLPKIPVVVSKSSDDLSKNNLEKTVELDTDDVDTSERKTFTEASELDAKEGTVIE